MGLIRKKFGLEYIIFLRFIYLLSLMFSLAYVWVRMKRNWGMMMRRLWRRLGLDFFDAVIWIYGGSMAVLFLLLFVFFWIR